MQKHTVAVMGCGWLGLPLAQHLLKQNYQVYGSTTSIEKQLKHQKLGIHSYVVSLNEDGIHGDVKKLLENVDTLIVNIPPGLRRNANKNHVAEIKHLIHEIEQTEIKHVLYVSSTSVFSDTSHMHIINDTTAPDNTTPTAQQLITIENTLFNNPQFKTTILRFGGLVDADRHPGKSLSGKHGVKNPEAPANLIHKIDCIGIITSIIEQEFWEKQCNAVYPLHETKHQFYTNFSEIHQLPKPIFDTKTPSVGKKITTQLVDSALQYKFKKHP